MLGFGRSTQHWGADGSCRLAVQGELTFSCRDDMHALPEGEYLGMGRGPLGSKRGEESAQLVYMRGFRCILAI